MRDKLISPKELEKFTVRLFDNQWQKAAGVLSGILQAGSIRLSRIAQYMQGGATANYKAIQRFLEEVEPGLALKRLFLEQSKFVLGDVTEIKRPEAYKTSYAGKLKDGKTRGFQLFILGCPFKGRVLPFHFISYSSRTISREATSRNLEHKRALRGLKEIIGPRAIVLDREFSYEGFFEACLEEGINLVVRLNVEGGVVIKDEDGERLPMVLQPGQCVVREGVYYKGAVKLNLIGKWGKGFCGPLWLITNLPPKEACDVYYERMKIEECFRDLKGLLGLGQVMNRKRENMEKMTAMLLMAYALGLLIGEEIRQRLYPERLRALFSGLHILLKHRLPYPKEHLQEILQSLLYFLWGNTYNIVRTPV